MGEVNVISLFDGMSCGRIALHKLGISPTSYIASEIDKFAIQVSKDNWDDITHVGDVTKLDTSTISAGSILIGGSPCQSFSFAGKMKGMSTKDEIEVLTLDHYLELKNLGYQFEGESYLFWEFVRVLKDVRPKYFLLENVLMKKHWQDIISDTLGVQPIKINSALVSAQNRKRLYWTNIPNVTVPEDRGILLSQILQDLPDCPIGVAVREKSCCIRVGDRNSPFGSKQIWDSPFQRVSKKGKIKPSIDKSGCLTGGAHSGGNHSDMDIIHTPYATRRYSVTECERLQTVPDGYCKSVSPSQAYKMLGNGWTSDVIAHILSFVPEFNLYNKI